METGKLGPAVKKIFGTLLFHNGVLVASTV